MPQSPPPPPIPSSSQTQSPTSPPTASPQSSTSSSTWTPKPIQALFSHFPLRILPANDLPSRSLSPSARRKNTLFIFTTTASTTTRNSANKNAETTYKIPSFNPTCLKWQTYLLTHGIDFNVRASNNHASLSGSLPFLIPASTRTPTKEKEKEKEKEKKKSAAASEEAIPATGLQRWVSAQMKQPDRYEDIALQESVYISLLDHRIRPAWLHSFYLTANLHSLAAPLYIHSVTTSALVRSWQTRLLRAAALAEVRRVYPLIETRDGAGDGDVLYDCAGEALEALDTALGEGDWFFGSSEPGVLDAAVFGYVHLILDDELGNGVGGRWAETEGSIRMRVLVEACERLRAHRMRMLERCYI